MALPNFIKPDWKVPPHIVAYTSCRGGGESSPPFDSLNVAQHVGDDPQVVEQNRSKLPNFQHYHWLNQIHSDICLELPHEHSASADAKLPGADACFTSHKNQVCAVMTADCLPLLLCNAQGTKVAAVHAGWRGLANNIIEKTIDKLACDTSSMFAWLGPAISQQYFEVGADVKHSFADFPEAFMPSSNYSANQAKYLADLYAIARAKLVAMGLHNISGGEYCTYEQADLFFSHRRATHQGLSTTGRIVTSIYIS
ncbi:MAG: peptidoglycan editing factor PgeF [Paraglaciecola sp.]|uniref:peptidoglycan editing factor PgeF n=1 Tax=Flavobacterium sp. W21_SRS_FM6 TaxID=3240268 RepID=UPI00276E6E5E|nr:peptidoglycan editing factor PgeF [Paraglaciecola sp.]